MEQTPAAIKAGTKRAWLVRGAIVLACLVAIVLFGRRAAAFLPTFTAWVDTLGIWAPVLFIAGYVFACVAFIPASILTIAAGATFGLVRGVLYVAIGASIGAIASFLISRYVARGAVERRLKSDPRLEAVDRAVAKDGRRIMLLMRISPAFPFGILNYALGLTRVTLGDFVIALIGILPGTTLYVYTGSVARTVTAAAGGTATPRGPAYWAILVAGLLATLAITVLVTRIARRGLAEARTDAPARD
ncbi:MAG TPA: TVP38/TMEM64 family protein [Gemmatimonadaceae bacterium]|nr:TVP38/TMEM64 family protein [Gemmatimonadaceae bacterium]